MSEHTTASAPPHIGLVTICRDLTRQAIVELSDYRDGYATRAAIQIGELRERLRQLDAEMWRAFSEPQALSPQEPSEEKA